MTPGGGGDPDVGGVELEQAQSRTEAVGRAASGSTMVGVQASEVLKMMERTSRLVNQGQVARAFEKQGRVARALAQQCVAARALEQQSAVARLARSNLRLVSPLRDVSRTWLASQYKAQADFAGIGKSNVLLAQAKTMRALDLDGFSRYVACTGTFAAPDRDSPKRKGKATIVLAGRERRRRPSACAGPPGERLAGYRAAPLPGCLRL